MQTYLIFLALVSVAALVVSAEHARFDNYRILSVKIANEEQRVLLEELAEEFDSVEIIKHSANSFVEIVVAPHKIADIEDTFVRNGIRSEVIHTNLQEYGLVENFGTLIGYIEFDL